MVPKYWYRFFFYLIHRLINSYYGKCLKYYWNVVNRSIQKLSWSMYTVVILQYELLNSEINHWSMLVDSILKIDTYEWITLSIWIFTQELQELNML